MTPANCTKSKVGMETNRQTNRIPEETLKPPELGAEIKNKGNEDYRYTGSQSTPWRGGGNSARGHPIQRISRQELERLAGILTERDLAILSSLHKCKYLNSGQIKRLHVLEAKTDTAALRATNRNLKKLKEAGLIRPLERQIGGSRGGSAALIWHLSEAGERLLNLQRPPSGKRKRFVEPSLTHLRHTLAVAECYVQIVEITRKHPEMRLALAEFEPTCWRPFQHGGRNIPLKPDLFIITESGEYEDRWFIEVDLATEALSVVTDKCERYHQYHQTGREQEKQGVFPVVLWIVPERRRKNNIIEAIRHYFKKWRTKLFAVITPDELEDLLLEGVQPETLH